MKRVSLVVIGSLMALLLGAAMAYSLLSPDIPMLVKPDLGVDLVYVYISAPISNQNLASLWRNSNSTLEASNMVFSYVVLLNITNYSNETVKISTFKAVIGPDVKMDENLRYAGSINPVVHDVREKLEVFGFDNTWMPKESRLIGLTGVNGSPEWFYRALNNSTIYMYGGVAGQVAYKRSWTTETGALKQVPLQRVEGDYLYNALLKDNQMLTLHHNGLDAAIVSRSQN